MPRVEVEASLTPPWMVSDVSGTSYSPSRSTSARRCSVPKDDCSPWCRAEPKEHWRVRDALAFTPKALQGDVLVELLKDRRDDPGLRESVLLALRRLVPIYWVRHASLVAATLTDEKLEVRVAALVALFHLDASDLDLQAGSTQSAVPPIVAALRDDKWPVREAALQTLRKLRPEQLKRLSHEVLRCKLDPSQRVRSAAQRVLERLAPNVLADLACHGARGGTSHEYIYSSFAYLHPLRGSEETFTAGTSLGGHVVQRHNVGPDAEVKALVIGSNLAVHADSSTPGADLLSVTLTVDQESAAPGGVLRKK
eukprot:Skav208100  [mRNA]  locus=scaffold1681:244687:247489:- [translate_table: standard]